MQWLQDYLYFLLCTFTLVIAIIAVVTAVTILSSKNKEKKGEIRLKELNKYYEELTDTLNQLLLDKKTRKQQKKRNASGKKAKKIKTLQARARCFVLRFNGDIRASQVEALTECINAILLVANPKDEVLLCLESAGGVVHGYGLASSQLQRIKQAKIKLTIAIDKIAASGGYMMAVVADHIISAPFAIIGSIGVVFQLPNLHRFLQDRHIDVELLTAGQYKRTLTILGENTSEGRAKMQEDIDETQELFKQHIALLRPQVNLSEVATGEHWHGTQAKPLQLVDEIQTSDDYLMSKRHDYHLVEIEYRMKRNLAQRFQLVLDTALSPGVYFSRAQSRKP